MYRNSLNEPDLDDGDEYYEFDGARLELKHTHTTALPSPIKTVHPHQHLHGDHDHQDSHHQKRPTIATVAIRAYSSGGAVSQSSSSVLGGSDSVSPEQPTTTPYNMSEAATANSADSPAAEQAAGTNTYPNTNSAIVNRATVRPKIGSPRHFFCFRRGLFDQAIVDCTRILLAPINDNRLVGSWLLTEISHWDHERERMVILTEKHLWIIKYDFIALRVLRKEKHPLNKFDTIQRGNLTYPSNSVVPKLEGLTNGVSSIFTGGIFQRNGASDTDGRRDSPRRLASKLPKNINLTQFQTIERNEVGVRLKWNKGQPLAVTSSWNPFADIPWKTFRNHPLGNYVDEYNSETTIREELEQNRELYLVDNMYNALLGIVHNPQPSIEGADINYNCRVEETPILLENYVNVGAMVHNKNNFGFFKVRGNFSF